MTSRGRVVFVLALVLEELAGLAFPDVVAADVLRPAAMTATGHFPLDDVIPDFATGYLEPEQPGGSWRTNVFSMPSVGSGDGGAIATATDLAAFLRAYDDGTLLGDLRADMLRAYADAGTPGGRAAASSATGAGPPPSSVTAAGTTGSVP